jgi:autotransporter-associated beta strand protein
LVKSGGSTLTLYGTNNTFTGSTTVSGGTLQVEASATLGNSTVISVTGGTLRLRNAASIPDTSSLTIADGGAMVRIDSGEETVGMLRLGTTRQRRGTYGASTSNAQYKNDAYFSTSGAGVIRVLRGPESVISVR